MTRERSLPLGTDNLRSDGGRNVMLLEVEQRLETMTLNGIFGQRGLFEAKAGDLLLEIVILLAGVAEVDIVGPTATNGRADAMEEALKRRNDGDGPIADKGDFATVGSAGFDRTPDLDGEADGLGEQHRHQDQNVFETCEEGFHALNMIIRELTCGTQVALWMRLCKRRVSGQTERTESRELIPPEPRTGMRP